MKSKRIALIFVAIAVLVVVGTAINFSLSSHDGTESGGSRTPLGALFHRAAAVSDLKQQMGELREAHTAFMQFAQAHQDELPKTIADLRPYLRQKLAYLDDKHWELPSTGKMTPLMNGSAANEAVLLQQKDLPPGRGKIVVYADGHIEYKK
jgi:hypothetical protein